MDRLTARARNGKAVYRNSSEENLVKNRVAVLGKLADYEDTGLTPEKILQMDKAYAEMCKELAELKKQLPQCKVGDTVWELCKCKDGVYRIFPMIVKQIIPYGAIRWVKGKEPAVWNIYAQSGYTDMYKRFYDVGETVFLSKEEAEQALAKMENN